MFKKKSTHNTIKTFTADVVLKKNAQPVFKKARPVPYALKEAVESCIETSVKEGILQPVKHSNWASPVVVVPSIFNVYFRKGRWPYRKFYAFVTYHVHELNITSAIIKKAITVN